MRRLLRSVIDVNGEITQENLTLNFQRLLNARIEWGRPDDTKLYNFTLGYFQQHMELPSVPTIFDYFNRIGDVEVTERLKDIQASQAYIRTNFSHLLKSILEEQSKIKAVALLKESHEIIARGIEIDGERKHGVRDGLMHFAQRANELIVPEFNGRIRGNIRRDGQAMIDEYQAAETNKDKVWGKFTGLNEIDKVCRGAKRGELWVHAAYPGELKCMPGDTLIFDHKTGRRRTLGELYATGDLPVVTALDHEGESTLKLVTAETSHLMENGVRAVFDLTLDSGRSVGATDNHKFLTTSGWKQLGELKVGDWVATPSIVRVNPQSRAYTDAEVQSVSKEVRTKGVPETFFGLPEDQVALFLGSLWLDGSCYRQVHNEDKCNSYCGRGRFSYLSENRQLCRDIQSLLLRLGIQSTLFFEEDTYYRVSLDRKFFRDLFRRTVRVEGTDESFSKLNPKFKPVDDRLYPSSILPPHMKIPHVWKTGKKGGLYTDLLRRRPCVSANTFAGFIADQNVAKTLSGDVTWDRVVSIAYRKDEMTYDLSVPGHQTFVANDIITHNTLFASNWCYNLCTHYKTNVVYISLEMPYEQIRRNIYTVHTTNMQWAPQGIQGLDYRKIRDGELTPEEKEFYFKQVIPDLNENPDYTVFEVVTPDKEWTMEDIRMEVELIHKQMDVGFVVIDHGQWVEARKGKKSKDYTIELNSVVRDAKRFALHFNQREGVPVLLLWQINRDGKEDANKNDGVYKAKALTYANEVEKTADVITTTYLNEDHRKNGTTKFANIKNRDNPLFEPFLARVDFVSRRIRNFDISEKQNNTMTAEDHASILDGMGLAGV